ncbi:hypothetical protein [Chitinophaga rhizophila]|uniref:Uncharacterized protein n=1 Tax=Chitinophaga rhizophila TaxID=2866212 RepID=A0ABS7GHW9_9BACT|nr:hypothetical protein [Chitinophaga rhizophila]MBW8687273.1 hypothetical protein [Chitinophaga rhizophila]
MKTENPYLFERLDYLITFELNPGVSVYDPITDDKAEATTELFKTEVLRAEREFRKQFFSETNMDAVASMVSKHYDAVVLMMHKVYDYLYPLGDGQQQLLSCCAWPTCCSGNYGALWIPIFPDLLRLIS